MENNKLNISNSPHIKSTNNTQAIMLNVIISLMPVLFFAIYHFGIYSLFIVLCCVVASMLSEYVFNIVTKRPNSLYDCSAIITGLLLGLNMPPRINLLIPILGSIFAIVVVKMLFGGLGQNFMNPALAGRCFLVISFASAMTNFSYDSFTSATPLYTIKQGLPVNVYDLIIGNVQGTIGEVSTIAILLGGIYLIIKKIIDYRLPLSYLISFIFFILLFSNKSGDLNFILTQIFGGGLFFGMFFMATDYVTSPATPFGKIIYGIILGILTGIFRLYSKSTEGITYAILLGNLLVPIIEYITIPKAFGRDVINEK